MDNNLKYVYLVQLIDNHEKTFKYLLQELQKINKYENIDDHIIKINTSNKYINDIFKQILNKLI